MHTSLGVEQSICLLIMLATQEHGGPLKSIVLSKRLALSDSYLKKTVRKLVVAGIVQSIASKDGGFKLKRQPKDISMLDIFEAIEGKNSFIQLTGLAEHVFLHPELVKRKEDEIMGYMLEAEKLFREHAAQYSLADILKTVSDQNGTVDWNAIVAQQDDFQRSLLNKISR